jgi:hypothetical protein
MPTARAPQLPLDLFVGRLSAFHDVIDPPRRTVERSARGVEQTPTLDANRLGGEVDLFRHFGGRQGDGGALFDGDQPGADIRSRRFTCQSR